MDHNGERWATVKQVAEALEYDDHRYLIRLIKRNGEDFQGKYFVVKTATKSKGSPNTGILNFRGVIRAAMLSGQPRAVQFRNWAK